MQIQRAYKTELKLNNQERSLLAGCAGAARYVWNWGLRQKIDEYEATGKTCAERSRSSPSYYELHRRLNALKKGELSWLYQYSKTIPQESLRDLDRAFANFFRRVKGNGQKNKEKEEKPGFPRFKSRKQGKGRFRVWGSIHVEDDRIKLPRIGWLRLKEKGYLPTSTVPTSVVPTSARPTTGVKVLSATVSERGGRWFVSLQVEEEIPDHQATGEPVGVDLGINQMAVTSSGQTYQNPKALRQALKRLARLQRELHRRKPGSRNRAKTRAKIARLHYRISCLRQDAIHQATSDIVARTKPDTQRPSMVVIENLNVKGMMQNRKLARSIADVGMGEFGRQIRYKCDWYGISLLEADRWFPSSKQCSRCGHRKELLTLSERSYYCPNCGLMIDRDLNAAINLKQLSTASSAGSEACGEVALAIL
jgi:putative transposase